MSAPRAVQSDMPGLAEPPMHDKGKSVFGPSLTRPRTVSVAQALFSPIPTEVAPPNDGNVTNIHGGNFYQAQTITLNQQINYVYTSTPGNGSPTDMLRAQTNTSLWINPLDISSKRTAKTGEVFQSGPKFQDWMMVLRSVLWVSGGPGAGKTFLASAMHDAVAATVENSPNDACTIIYLKQNDQWTAWDIVAAIVINLVESNPLPAALDAVYNALVGKRHANGRPSLKDLVALLQTIVRLYGRCYIFIDGIDEMKLDIQIELVKMIAELDANVLLTSRPLELIQDKLDKLAPIRPVFMTFAAIPEDLVLFIEDTIDRTPTFANLLTESFPKERLVEKIQTNARGMFLHAALQMEALRDCIDQQELIDTLDRFPPGLKEMYADIVKRIERQPPGHASRAKTALVWLVHANGVLSIDDLRCATATFAPHYRVESNRQLSVENLLTICCGLVTLDPETRQARLIHATARDALRDILTGHCAKPHAMMATASIARLVEFNLHQSKLTSLEKLEVIYEKGPLIRYAHRAVQHHVQMGVEEDPGLLPGVEAFVLQCTSFPYEDPFTYTVHGLLPIHVATLFNQKRIIEALLGDGSVDINTKTSHEQGGISPLAIASSEGLDDLTQYLLTIPGIHPNDGDLTPLMCAALTGREAVVTQLLLHLEAAVEGQGSQSRTQLKVDINRRSGRDGDTALALAALTGQAAVVKLLLGVEGTDVNDNSGCSPLFNSPGIDINQTSNDGFSPLFMASQEGHVEVVKLLVNAPGIDVNQANNNGISPLLMASQKGHVEVVKLLVNATGIDVNQADDDGVSPLFMASQKDHVEVVKLLVNATGIDVNQANNNGVSPLFMASQKDHVEVVKLLVNAPGIDVNQANNNGTSPLFMASQEDHVEVVKLLVNAPGIDVNQTDNNGTSPLLMASQKGHVEVVKLLVKATGIDVNQANSRQVSPLIIAAYSGHLEVVKALLGVPGIDIVHEDMDDDTAITAASGQGHDEIARTLSAALDTEPVSLRLWNNDPQDSQQSASEQANAPPPLPVVSTSPMLAPELGRFHSARPPVSPLPLVDPTTSIPNIACSSPQPTEPQESPHPPPSLDSPQPKANRERQSQMLFAPLAADPATADSLLDSTLSPTEVDERTPPSVGPLPPPITLSPTPRPRISRLSSPAPPSVSPPAVNTVTVDLPPQQVQRTDVHLPRVPPVNRQQGWWQFWSS